MKWIINIVCLFVKLWYSINILKENNGNVLVRLKHVSKCNILLLVLIYAENFRKTLLCEFWRLMGNYVLKGKFPFDLKLLSCKTNLSDKSKKKKWKSGRGARVQVGFLAPIGGHSLATLTRLTNYWPPTHPSWYLRRNSFTVVRKNLHTKIWIF